jgi:hypothetical protein
VAVRKGLDGLSKALNLRNQDLDATSLWTAANMYIALILLFTLAFLSLCLVGLFTLIRQAIADPPYPAQHVFIQDPLPAAAVPSEDSEGGACGEGCA